MYNSQPARLLLKRSLVWDMRITERNRQRAKDIENDLRPVRFIWKTRRKTKRGKKPKRNIHRRFPVVFLSVHLVRHQFLLDPFIVLFILFAFRCVSSEPKLNINCIYGDISQKHKSYFKRFSPPSCTLQSASATSTFRLAATLLPTAERREKMCIFVPFFFLYFSFSFLLSHYVIV